MRERRLAAFVAVVGGVVEARVAWLAVGQRSSMTLLDLMILPSMAAAMGRTVVETVVGIAALRHDVGRWAKQR